MFLKLYDTASDNISAVSGRELSAHPYWPPLPASCAECWPSHIGDYNHIDNAVIAFTTTSLLSPSSFLHYLSAISPSSTLEPS